MIKPRCGARLLSYGTLIGVAVAFLLPFLWMVITSFDSAGTSFLKKPESITLQNYANTLSSTANIRSFGNGIILAFGQGSIVCIVSFLAAYALSRFPIRLKKVYLYGILFLTGLPAISLIIPIYFIFFKIGYIDTLAGIILFSSATSLPFAIWIAKNFIDAFPVALEEAAWLDGANHLVSLLRIVLPSTLPGLFIVFLINFSTAWGNFFTPFILLNSYEKYPPAILIYQFFGQNSQINYGGLTAYSLLYTLPVLVIYLVSQNYMSKGFILSGGEK